MGQDYLFHDKISATPHRYHPMEFFSAVWPIVGPSMPIILGLPKGRNHAAPAQRAFGTAGQGFDQQRIFLRQVGGVGS
jgi:hypothetical protein